MIINENNNVDLLDKSDVKLQISSRANISITLDFKEIGQKIISFTKSDFDWGNQTFTNPVKTKGRLESITFRLKQKHFNSADELKVDLDTAEIRLFTKDKKLKKRITYFNSDYIPKETKLEMLSQIPKEIMDRVKELYVAELDKTALAIKVAKILMEKEGIK